MSNTKWCIRNYILQAIKHIYRYFLNRVICWYCLRVNDTPVIDFVWLISRLPFWKVNVVYLSIWLEFLPYILPIFNLKQCLVVCIIIIVYLYLCNKDWELSPLILTVIDGEASCCQEDVSVTVTQSTQPCGILLLGAGRGTL